MFRRDRKLRTRSPSSFPVMPELVTTLALLVGFLYSQSTMSLLPMNELRELFPHVVSWITGLDKQANESGRTLNPLEYDLAREVGVNRPEDVRILSVPQIPKPDHPRVRDLAEKVGLLTPDTGGLTAVHGLMNTAARKPLSSRKQRPKLRRRAKMPDSSV
jgi:hypothetical protein